MVQNKKITVSEIVSLANNWQDLYHANNREGDKAIAFVAGNQWDNKVARNRIADGKEVLTLNVALKHYYRILSDYANVEYQLSCIPLVDKTTDEIKAAEEALKAIILSTKNTQTFSEAFDKYLTFGYAVLKVVPDYAANNSMQLLPTIKHVSSPENVFFDFTAKTHTKEDGRFCGEVKTLSRSTLYNYYPAYAKKYYLEGDNGYLFNASQYTKVYDFYYKQEKAVKFYKVNNQYKKEDELTAYELGMLDEFEVQEKFITVVYTCTCTESEMLVEPHEFSCNQLPYVYIGKPFRTSACHDSTPTYEMTLPYLSLITDAQRMLNNASSQLATQVSKKMERSIVATQESIDPDNIDQWQNINTQAGVFLYKSYTDSNNPLQKPDVLEPSPIDPTLLAAVQTCKMLTDEVAGMNLSQQGSSQDGAQSGVALAQRIIQGDLIQKQLFYTFVNALNRVGVVVKEMLMFLVADEYKLNIGNKFAVLNKKIGQVGEQPIRNSTTKQLHTEYEFSIEATPSSQIEQQRSAETMLQLIRTLPELAPYMMDLVVENLTINCRNELLARAKTLVDPAVRAVGDGDMSEEEYYALQKQRQQEAAQNAQDPLMASVEMEAANNAQKNQLKAQEQQQKFIIEKDKLLLKKAALMQQGENEEKERALKELDIQLKNLDKYIKK